MSRRSQPEPRGRNGRHKATGGNRKRAKRAMRPQSRPRHARKSNKS
jgi:hypothetical protein